MFLLNNFENNILSIFFTIIFTVNILTKKWQFSYFKKTIFFLQTFFGHFSEMTNATKNEKCKKIGKLFYPRGIFRQMTDATKNICAKNFNFSSNFFIFGQKKIGKLYYPRGIFRQMTDASNYFFLKKRFNLPDIFIFGPKTIGKLCYPRGIFRQMTDAPKNIFSKKMTK